MPFMALPSPHSSISTLLCPRDGLTLDGAVFISAVLTHWLWIALVHRTHRIPRKSKKWTWGLFSRPLLWRSRWSGYLSRPKSGSWQAVFFLDVLFHVLGLCHSLRPWFYQKMVLQRPGSSAPAVCSLAGPLLGWSDMQLK